MWGRKWKKGTETQKQKQRNRSKNTKELIVRKKDTEEKGYGTITSQR